MRTALILIGFSWALPVDSGTLTEIPHPKVKHKVRHPRSLHRDFICLTDTISPFR